MNLNLTAFTRYGLNFLGMLGVSVALYFGSSIFIPLTMSALLAALLYPLAAGLHLKLRLPWFFACFSSIMILIVMAGTVTVIAAAAIPQFINRLPSSEEGKDGWKQKYEDVAENLHAMFPTARFQGILPLKANESNVYRSVKELFTPQNVADSIKGIAGVGLRQLTELVLILFIVLFLLLEAELLAKKVRAIFGTSEDTQGRVTAALAAIAESIRTYLYWRTIVNFVLAVVLCLFYKYVCGLEQYLLWGVVTFVFTYVPYIGTLAAGVLPMLEAVIQGQPTTAFGIMLVYACVVTFEGYIIVPWVMGRSMDLNATTVMIACLYWHLVWGIAGLFLAMPLMAILKAVLLHVDGWVPYGDLLSSVDPRPEKNVPSADSTVAIERERLDNITERARNNPEATVIMDEPNGHVSDKRVPS